MLCFGILKKGRAFAPWKMNEIFVNNLVTFYCFLSFLFEWHTAHIILVKKNRSNWFLCRVIKYPSATMENLFCDSGLFYLVK